MLQRLHVDNYRCLVDFELRLQALCLLLGPNGVGKSSVLDVVFALRQLLDGSAKVTDEGVFPASTLTRWQHQDVQVFEIEVLLEPDRFTYRLEVEHERSTRRARVRSEKLVHRCDPDRGTLFEFELGKVQLRRDDYSFGPQYHFDWSESALARVAERPDNRRLTRFLQFVRRIQVCSLYPPGFRAESRSEDSILHRDSRNFADWYRHMNQERPDLLAPFTFAIREIIPDSRGIRLEQVGRDTRALTVMFENGRERYELRLDELSDGQRALIVLHALVHLAADQGYTLFLDEPDNYVALPEIQPWLREIEDACGGAVMQAVISSHHPELMDYFGIDNSYAFHRLESGRVSARKIEVRPTESGLKLSELIARGWEK